MLSSRMLRRAVCSKMTDVSKVLTASRPGDGDSVDLWNVWKILPDWWRKIPTREILKLNYIERSWEAKSRLASQEIPHFYGHKKKHYCVHKNLPLVCILKLLSPSTHTTHYIKIHIILSSVYAQITQVLYLLQVFRPKVQFSPCVLYDLPSTNNADGPYLKKYVNNHTTITSLSLLHSLSTCFQVAARSPRKIFVQVQFYNVPLLATVPSRWIFGLAHLGLSLRTIVTAFHFYSSLKILRPDVEG
jgi:hypothetical protein